MTYIIAEPCIDIKDLSCVDVCPVDCIHEFERILIIDPEECIDCGACEPECPVEAIFPEDALPDKWEPFVKINYAYGDGADVMNKLTDEYATEHNVQNPPSGIEIAPSRGRSLEASRKRGSECLSKPGATSENASTSTSRTAPRSEAPRPKSRQGDRGANGEQGAREKREARTSSRSSTRDMSSGRRGGLRSRTGRTGGHSGPDEGAALQRGEAAEHQGPLEDEQAAAPGRGQPEEINPSWASSR